MKLVSFKPNPKGGTFAGEAAVYFPEIKMTMEVSIINGKNGLFASLPQRVYELNGEKKYHSLVKFDDNVSKEISKDIIHQYKLFTEDKAFKGEQNDLPF
jgi:DNA-binding cell septation regulator SpoVG